MNAILTRTPTEESLGVALPHRRMEEWKWTDLRRLLDKPYGQAANTAAPKDVERLLKLATVHGVNTRRIVFVNGQLQVGSKLLDTAACNTIEGSDPLVVMGNALGGQGVDLCLSGNVDTPIEIIHIATKGETRAIGYRHRVTVEAGASATLIETFIGEGEYLSNSLVEISLGDGATLDRIKVEQEAPASTHLAHTAFTLGAKAILRDFTLTSGAKLVRHNGTCTFNGEYAEAHISGSYLLKGRQHGDTRLIVDHAVPHCTSRELFKVVMDDHARGIFQGKVIVRPHAQKTDGKQSSHALLLSETAEFDAKPELEIYADDVVCGHGATSGDLNHDYLFYLMSRGVPKAEARAMLVAAFVGEAIETVQHEKLREALLTFAASRLAE